MSTTPPNSQPFYLVGLVGYKQSGKDTVAVMLRRHFPGLEYVHVSFARPGKEEVAEILGTTLEHIESHKNHPLIRHILQWYLNDYKKPVEGNDVWVKKAAATINELRSKNSPQLFVITDFRHLVEFNWFKEVGGITIKVDRFDSSDDTHASEQELKQIQPDFHIPNKGTLRDLEREVYWVSGFLKERWKLI